MKKCTILIATIMLLACSHTSPEELASKAAMGYYNLLMSGDYEGFLEGVDDKEHPGTIDYRSQLIDNYRQFTDRLQKQHQGIREVRVSHTVADSTLQTMNVFLVLCFGDGTREETIVPMVERDGHWLMR